MKNKKLFMVLGIGLTIVLLVGAILQLTGTVSFLSTTPIGCSGTVDSIDSVTIRTSADLGGKKVIRVKYSTLPTSECLDITLSESQIEDNLITNENFEVTDKISGNIQLLYQRKESTIIKKTEKYFTFQNTEISGTWFCTKSACESEGVSGTFKVYTEGGKCFCVTDEQVGNKATFTSSGNLIWETEVNIGSEKISLNEGKLSGKIGNIAFVKWGGNIVSNYVLNGVFQEAYFHLADNKYRMVELGNYIEVEAERKRIRNNLDDCIFCGDEIDDMHAYNSFLISKTKDRTNAWANDEPGVDNAKIVSNKLIIDVGENTLVYPTFTLDIDAKEVGIFISHGEPKAICPDDFSINSGNTFSAKATAKNIGTSSGSFTWWIDCDKGSQTVYPGPPLTIGPGMSKTISITSGLTVESGTETSRCKFFVKEVNSLEEDYCTFKYDSTKVTQCTSGVKSCENGNSELWTCLSDGSYDKTKCDYGCESFGNSFRCRLQSTEICDNGIDDDGNGLIDEEDPQCAVVSFWDKIVNWFKNLFSGVISLFMIIKYIAVAIGGFFAFAFSKNLLDEKSNLEKNWILGISIIIGLLISYVLVKFIYSPIFWIILVVLLVFQFFGLGKFIPKRK